MMWLSWRQFRWQAAVAAAALLAALVAVVATKPGLADLYDSTIAPCLPPADCTVVVRQFLASYPMIQSLEVVLLVVPALIGMFWGAPLVAREFETGTYRLAWTQSVTRSRWLAVKLLVVGLASVAATGLLSLVVSWWSSPLDFVRDDAFSPIAFGERGIVSMGYAAFAFMLGATAGLFIKRTVAAMATTLIVFIAVRIAVTEGLRPRFLSPVQGAMALDPLSTGYGSFSTGSATLQAFGWDAETLQPGNPNLPDAWIFSNEIVDQAGAPLTPDFVAHSCPRLGPAAAVVSGPEGASHAATEAFSALRDCVAKVGTSFHQLVTYQPADRFWLFQGIETALYVGFALALAGISFWWIRRRLT